MKKLIVFFYSLSISVFSIAQYGGDFQLNIELIGIDSGKIHYSYSKNIDNYHSDSVDINDNKAIINGDINLPTRISIKVKTPINKIYCNSFFIDTGRINVIIDTSNLRTNYYGYWINAKVQGSKSDDIYNKGLKIPNDILSNDIRQIEEKYELKENYPFDSIKYWKGEIQRLLRKKIEQVKLYTENYNKYPVVVKNCLQESMNYTFDDAISINYNIRDMLDETSGFDYEKEVFKTRKRNFIGDTLPETILQDTSGNLISLKQFKGQYLVLDFWGSWCKPCVEAFPKLKRLHEKYGNADVVFVGVSIDIHKNKWLNAIKYHELPWLQLVDPKGDFDAQIMDDLYVNKGIPHYIIINPNGKIIYKGGSESTSKLFIEYILRKNEND